MKEICVNLIAIHPIPVYCEHGRWFQGGSA